MKKIFLTVLLFGLALMANAQSLAEMKIRTISLVSAIDQNKTLTQKDFSVNVYDSMGNEVKPKVTCIYFYDPKDNSLQKVSYSSPKTPETQTYYFSDDRLVYLKLPKKEAYFFMSDYYEFDYKHGEHFIWGDTSIDSDKELSRAYRFLITFKDYINKR